LLVAALAAFRFDAAADAKALASASADARALPVLVEPWRVRRAAAQLAVGEVRFAPIDHRDSTVALTPPSVARVPAPRQCSAPLHWATDSERVVVLSPRAHP